MKRVARQPAPSPAARDDGALADQPRDTIVAIATPPGAGAVGLIRVSGPGAVGAAAAVARLDGGRPLGEAEPRRLHRAAIVDPATGAVIDQALAVRLPAPRSYTGEDVVELSCHGNPLLLAQIVQWLTAHGARLAAPGEFTRRAYVNGRMDLLQAEAVAELIAAKSARALELAARELRGGLSRDVHAIRERALDLVAGLEVALDFPEDEVGTSRPAALGEMRELLGQLDRLLDGARRGRVVTDGIAVMLVGAPNVGKSSLFNALLGRDRAIVAPEAGTTRDLVESSLALAGVQVRLLDGAGLGPARDAIDAEAMRRAREAIQDGDLLLVVVDASTPDGGDARDAVEATRGRARLVVGNKCDLAVRWTAEPPLDVVCSAKTGAGLEDLRARIEAWIGSAIAPDGEESAVVASLRVVDELCRARHALARACEALEAGVALEAALVDLRDVLGSVDALLGVSADDAVLDRIFARFCVGK